MNQEKVLTFTQILSIIILQSFLGYGGKIKNEKIFNPIFVTHNASVFAIPNIVRRKAPY